MEVRYLKAAISLYANLWASIPASFFLAYPSCTTEPLLSIPKAAVSCIINIQTKDQMAIFNVRVGICCDSENH